MSAPATPPPVVSVVMPAYNEAEHIEACVTEWHDAVIAALPGSEIIVIDDCSRDQTFALLQQMATRLPALRVLQTPTNLGHGPALRLALEACRGDFIFQTDSDRQHTPDDFWAFWQRRQDADLLVGVRTTRADGTFRRIVSSVMRALNLAIWQTWLPDANCPFKLMRRTVLDVVLPAIPRTSFIPMVMLSMLAGRAGFTVVSLTVHHFPRRAGEQSLAGVMRWARVGTRCAIELVRLRFAAPPSRRSAKPARSVSS